MLNAFFNLPLSFHLTHVSVPTALIVFLAGGLFTIVLGQLSLQTLDPVKRWTSIGLRLLTLLLLILALGGLQWERRNDRLDVMVACDVSGSTGYVRNFKGANLQGSLDRWLEGLSRRDSRRDDDAVGELTFDDRPVIDALPAGQLNLATRALRRPGDGTDAAAAINLAMAAFRPDAMRRIVLMWDGNQTTGELDAAVSAAAAAHVPIDVAPLSYSVKGAVILDKFVAPARRRAGEPFTLDVVLRNTSVAQVRGTLFVDSDGQILSSRRLTLRPGLNAEHISMPPFASPGLRRFHTRFDPDDSSASVNSQALDSLRTANAFTFVTGKGRTLYVDGVEGDEGHFLADGLTSQGIALDDSSRIHPEQFPESLVDLEQYDAVILANVRRGQGGLTDAQARLLEQYVQETGGGLVVVGGPDALGAGGWIGSPLEKLLPVECSVPAVRSLPAGGLVLVIDHSGSMGEAVVGSKLDKQQIANEAAALALQTMMPNDYFGVIAFDSAPVWVVPLRPNSDAARSAELIRAIRPAGGTAIYPALDLAERALAQIAPGQAPIKHVILLTDGDSQAGDYEGVIRRMAENHITLLTIGVGLDANQALLERLAMLGNGRFYPVADPRVLPRVFIREATVLRRPLIHEDPRGLATTIFPDTMGVTRGLTGLDSVYGMVLTTARRLPGVEVEMTAGPMHDPLLASWQAGLGRVAVFTSDAGRRWAPRWVGSAAFGKFWAQLIRSVERAPADGASDVQLTVSGKRASVRLELTSPDGSPARQAGASAVVLSPGLNSRSIQLVQQSPGSFTADFDLPEAGENMVAFSYQARNLHGIAVAGADVKASEELAALRSDDQAVAAIAARTDGRVLKLFDPDVDLFDRDGLSPSSSRTPLGPKLLMMAIVTFLFDVAARRVAWDRHSWKQGAMILAGFVRSYTAVPTIAPQATLDAASRARAATKERFDLPPVAGIAASPEPDRARSTGHLAGGSLERHGSASAAQMKGRSDGPRSHDRLGSLIAAKRRAQKKLERDRPD
jgi:Ca-activated chloride channel family protein